MATKKTSVYYKLIKRMIEDGNYESKEDMARKIKTLTGHGLSQEEAEELLAMLDIVEA